MVITSYIPTVSAHKVVQQFDEEVEAYNHALESTREQGYKIIAMPIDTYDPNRFIDKYAVSIAQRAKQYGLTVIFRPDSGDVVDQAVNLYRKMMVHGLTNTGVIIGEGMSRQVMEEYDAELIYQDVPLNYVSYGIGAGFYKHINRDTLGFAMKTSYSNGSPRMKFCRANPIKQSLPGMVNLIRDENNNMVVDYTSKGLYETIYEMEVRSWRPIVKKQNYDDIKKTALSQDTSQKEIIISSEVQKQINTLEKRYLQ